MIRFPNKLYSFKESIFAFFPQIMSCLSDRRLSVSALYNELKDEIPTQDFIDALTFLLLLRKVAFDPTEGSVWRVN